ncbi:hypothetical protein [Blastopirellula retiformator]|uniref:Uncharacterized protein n=1 Tax=Blastopirellula retiformator TaxID=2527970 RepID=A0A5C5V3Z7_9BACT|nr:hypothetical protein [Blastopirellula retiformator]TWT33284.1 hypothetical protein Enr8_31090 [Blastopirellula retiformator]
MHSRDQVQLAALLATHAPIQIRSMKQISAKGLEQYWTNSKARLDRWGRLLKDHSESVKNATAADLPRHWETIRPVLEEILISDVLTRIWTSLCIAFDKIHRSETAEATVRSVFIGHLEARNRALNLMVYGRGLDADLAVKLNRLRRRTERWTDMLLGYVAVATDVRNMGFDNDRVQEFCRDIREQARAGSHSAGWPLLLSSALDAFRTSTIDSPAHPQFNQQIAAAIMSCFGPELFDSTGVIRPLWELRISNYADDTQTMVEQLLSLESPDAAVPIHLGSDHPSPRF